MKQIKSPQNNTPCTINSILQKPTDINLLNQDQYIIKNIMYKKNVPHLLINNIDTEKEIHK
jgi:hypothetical protein